MRHLKEVELGFGDSDDFGPGGSISEYRLQLIDKVVRMRGKNGRLGTGNSELLNYELEQKNKPNDDHMNWMVNWKSMTEQSKKQGFTVAERP